MLRLGLTAVFGLLFSFSYGQLKKFYSLRETSGYDTVQFTLAATAGNCFVRASEESEGALAIYGNPDLDKINPSFKSSVANGTCVADLDLKEFRSSSFSDGILFAVVRSDENQNNYWKVLFDESKIYRLNLSYGFGNADVDLSGTSVKNFKVKSGSADIVIDYADGKPNRVLMDTFYVKVDMGSIVAKHLELAQARYINACIGFGSALLNFSAPPLHRCEINASVGAGNLDVVIPQNNVPVIIRVKDSPFCSLRILDGFEEVENDVYVNMAYQASASNLMTFNIDVALGNVSFYYAE